MGLFCDMFRQYLNFFSCWLNEFFFNYLHDILKEVFIVIECCSIFFDWVRMDFRSFFLVEFLVRSVWMEFILWDPIEFIFTFYFFS